MRSGVSVSFVPLLAFCGLFALFAFFAAAGVLFRPAGAARAMPPEKLCLSPQEAEARQAIRIHSELMVIGLNCKHMTPAGWTDFYQQYKDITREHRQVISAYEAQMLSYYGRHGHPSPEKELRDLRTRFANSISAAAAQMRPDVFCATYAPRLPKVAAMRPGDFQRWAASSWSERSARPERPVCKQ